MDLFNEVTVICKELMSIDSPTGFTHNIMKYIENYVKELGLEFKITNKGLGYCYQINEEKNLPVGVVSHVDTIGLAVRSITNDGNLRFAKVGGINLATIDGEYCRIYTRGGVVFSGTIVHDSTSVHVHKNAKTEERTDENMYVRLDKEVYSKEDVLNIGIKNGDFIAIDTKYTVVNDFIKSRFLDDKLCVAQSLVMLKNRVKQGKSTPYVYFSAQEEVGHGFSQVPLAEKIDELIVLDMGCVGLDLEGSEYKVSICALDASGPYDYTLNNELIDIAVNNKIAHAIDYYRFYSSDGTAALRAGNDFKVALIGSGIDASHGMERTHRKGLESCCILLEKYLDKRNDLNGK